ncbi:hypothetical protein CALVIDRAFT_417210 [Calocera viscosa TUFC12733]|uniref:Uncharacterized protein n=1 Tax=Calocera viscosa (strain TUFC12733) TaxID=1330018 RepID=A0A167PG03_CALVF|nr:hypothetical protein CALVIDRAFT_417210 [Calocera viscosa TUFC12733]
MTVVFRVTFVLAVTFLATVVALTPNDVTGKLGPGCTWQGKAPLCNGECPSGMFEIVQTNDNEGFAAYLSFGLDVPPQRWNTISEYGDKCGSGKKLFCCSSSQYQQPCQKQVVSLRQDAWSVGEDGKWFDPLPPCQNGGTLVALHVPQYGRARKDTSLPPVEDLNFRSEGSWRVRGDSGMKRQTTTVWWKDVEMYCCKADWHW